MFTNPFNKKYQDGGSAPTDEQKKEMQGFVTWIKSNIEGFKDKSEQEIAKSLSDMAKSDEGKKSVQDLYSRYQKSKKQKSKFEDGGKFQSFICKHGHGGDIGCGCSGGKVIRGEEGVPGIDENDRIDNITGKRYQEILPNGTIKQTLTRNEPDNTTSYTTLEITPQQDSTFRAWNTRYGDDNINTYRPVSQYRWYHKLNPFVSIAPKNWIESFKQNFVQSEEDGGIVMGKDGLSRKQIRQDKRKVLRAMNRPTAGAQYENLMNQTRNWDRFAGMSRLERKNAINQLILNGEKPIVQTPIQPDLGENYVINETTVPYQFFNPTPQVVETPKVETVTTQTQSTPTATTQRSASTRRSNIARPEDFPMQEIVIPQISTNIPFGKGSRTSEKEITPVIEVGPLTETRDYQSEISDAMHKFGPWVEWGQGGIYETDSEGNGVYWIRNAEGKLEKHEPIVKTSKVVSAPKRTYTLSGTIGNPWDVYKCGGKVEKHQQEDGVGRGKLNEYYPANETGQFGKRVENLYTPDRNHLILITEPGKVSERRDSSFVFISPNSKSANPAISRRYKTFDKFTDKGPFEGMRNLWENWKLHANKNK